jgi:hypothetical protein
MRDGIFIFMRHNCMWTGVFDGLFVNMTKAAAGPPQIMPPHRDAASRDAGLPRIWSVV